MCSYLIAHETEKQYTSGDNEVAEFFPNKPSGVLGNAAIALALEVSEELKLLEY